MNPLLDQILSIILLVLGFGFVIFFHELGHFLAAKWVGIKVEQFAVGFGQAFFSWRKGLGLRFGSSTKEYEARVAQGATDIGETEYRLNWIPLGGYVKMLGQDDLKANAQQDDPRAYNRKSIGARMIVVSAGVIMNIILAAIGFMIVFLIGFNAPPAVVGGIIAGSPADKAGLQVGDRILYLENKYQHDFTKITLNTALMEEGVAAPLYVQHVDGRHEHLQITAERPDNDPKAFLMLGIVQPTELRGLDPRDMPTDEELAPVLVSDDTRTLRAGDAITEINGQAVKVDEYYKLDRALQESSGKAIDLTVKSATGVMRHVQVRPDISHPFGNEPATFGGLEPRTIVEGVMPESPARGKILPGDVIVVISDGDGQKSNPSTKELTDWLNNAGQKGQAVNIEVLRGEKRITLEGLKPNVHVAKDRYGLKISLRYDADHTVVAAVSSGAPFKNVEKGDTVTAVNGTPVKTWFDVKDQLAKVAPDQHVVFTFRSPNEHGEEKTADVTFTQAQLDATRSVRYTHAMLLHERVEPRKTTSPLVAAGWGVTETRDFVLQFYLTIKRMFQGSVSYTNMMGPVGIFHAGTKFAYKGNDWLIWFLSMISANLAVVNFLPIPIVDGGLFTFLILEKIMGKPLSPKAQSIAQVVGLALILGVFLLVTYQDISRFFL